MTIRKTTSGIFGSLPREGDAPTESADVLAVGAGTVDVRTGDGTVYRRVPLAGAAIVGGTVDFRVEGGKPQAYGAGAGPSSGALILAGSAGDVAPGLYVPLSRSINTTNGLTGGGTLASDLTLQVDSSVVRTGRQINTTNGLTGGGTLASDLTLQVDSTVVRTSRQVSTTNGLTGGGALTSDLTLQVDSTVARAGWQVVGGGSLGGGGGLSASGITITMNTPGTITPSSTNDSAITNHTHALDVNAAWTWGGLHTFNAGARVATNQSIGTPSFVSGFAGSGWRVDHGVSTSNQTTAEFDNLTVRGVMRVYELLIHKIRTGNGSYLFAPGGKVESVSGSGPYTITFESDHGLAVNDLIRAQKFDLALGGVYQSNLTVTAVNSTTQVVASLHSGNAPARGYEYARIGNTSNTDRQGGVYVTSDDSNAPYLDVFDGVASFSDWGASSRTRLRLGRLSGWGSHYPTMTYGMVAGRVDGLWIGIDTTNGFRIMRDTTQVARWNTSGAITIGESAVQLSLDTTSGFRITRSGTQVAQWSTSGAITIGESAVQLSLDTTSGFRITRSGTQVAQWSTSGAITIGESAVQLNLDTSSGFRITRSGTQVAQWSTSGAITIGESAVQLSLDTTSGFRITRSGTQVAQWDTSGNITIGEVAANKANTLITAGEIRFRSNVTTYIRIASDGRLVMTPGTAATSAINWETDTGSFVGNISAHRSGALSTIGIQGGGGGSGVAGIVELVADNASGSDYASLRVIGSDLLIRATKPIYISGGGNGLTIAASYVAPPDRGIYAEGGARFGGWVRIGDVASPTRALDVAGEVSCSSILASNWFRSTGNSGWYSQDYGGGIWMTDTTWIRTYGGKSFYCSEHIRAERSLVGGDFSMPVTHCRFIAGASGTGHSAQAAIYITTGMGTGWQQITNVGVSYRARVVGVLVISSALAFEVSAFLVAGTETIVVDHDAGGGTIYRLSMLCNSNGVYVRSNFANYNGYFSTMLICT